MHQFGLLLMGTSFLHLLNGEEGWQSITRACVTDEAGFVQCEQVCAAEAMNNVSLYNCKHLAFHKSVKLHGNRIRFPCHK